MFQLFVVMKNISDTHTNILHSKDKLQKIFVVKVIIESVPIISHIVKYLNEILKWVVCLIGPRPCDESCVQHMAWAL